ncbi:MAG: hypothetical protein ACR2NH_07080 [Solirubrobacteraceae bacterium]
MVVAQFSCGRDATGPEAGDDQPGHSQLRRAEAEERSAKSSGSGGCPSAGPRGDARGDAGTGEHACLQAHAGDDGEQDRHFPALAADLPPEGAATVAVADVTAQAGPPQRSAGEGRELLANLRARGLARLTRRAQG